MSEHQEYWQKRAQRRLLEAEQMALRAEKVMKKVFDAAAKDIALQIYKLYGRYAKDNHLTYDQALLYLTNDERTEFQRDLAFYLEKMHDSDYRIQHKAYLQALSTRVRIKRLEAYQAELTMLADELYGSQVIPLANETAVTIAQDSYYKTAFDLSQEAGFLLAFDKPTPQVIDTILEYPWSGKDL